MKILNSLLLLHYCIIILVLGTMTFSAQTDKREAAQMMESFAHSGFKFVGAYIFLQFCCRTFPNLLLYGQILHRCIAMEKPKSLLETCWSKTPSYLHPYHCTRKLIRLLHKMDSRYHQRVLIGSLQLLFNHYKGNQWNYTTFMHLVNLKSRSH